MISFHLSVIRMPPKNTNSVLIDDGVDAVIFDPWGTASDWLALLRERNLHLTAMYCTHGHFDHISAIPELVEKTNTPWLMHPADIPVIDWSNPILKEIGMHGIDLEKIPPRDIAPGLMEILPGFSATVIHTPGHSAGGICVYINNPSLYTSRLTPHVLIAGDTIFQKDHGRTDLPTGDQNAMNESLCALYRMNFPDDTLVIHGHGPETTIGWLKENNSFFKRC